MSFEADFPGAKFYKYIVTATTTVCKASEGVLHTVSVNTAVSSATATLYDNASAGSGTVIAVIDASVNGTHFYDVAFLKGLTIVTNGIADITVSLE